MFLRLSKSTDCSFCCFQFCLRVIPWPSQLSWGSLWIVKYFGPQLCWKDWHWALCTFQLHNRRISFSQALKVWMTRLSWVHCHPLLEIERERQEQRKERFFFCEMRSLQMGSLNNTSLTRHRAVCTVVIRLVPYIPLTAFSEKGKWVPLHDSLHPGPTLCPLLLVPSIWRLLLSSRLSFSLLGFRGHLEGENIHLSSIDNTHLSIYLSTYLPISPTI